MGGEVMEPILCHGSTQVYTYLQRELGRSQLGGAGEQYTLVHTTVYLAPSPSATLAPPPPPLPPQGVSSGRQRHHITTTLRPIKVDLQYHSIPK